MACPTCDHTMQSVAVSLFWCPRCGTLKQQTTEIPLLVKRLRQLDHVADKADIVDMLLRLRGISDAIYRPQDR